MEDRTLCVHHPKVSTEGFASLTVPTYRASTIVFPDGRAYAERKNRGPDGYTYGAYGTPTTRTLEAQITALHRGERTLVLPTGQAAIAVVMLSLLGPGERVLIPDTAYPPVRDLCEQYLLPRGIGFEIYDPTDVNGLPGRLAPDVRLLWLESPGSTTMEIQDVRAMAAIAHEHGALVGCDNTWATPLLFKPLEHGVDFVVEALTKYVGGHSDILLGSITVSDMAWFQKLRRLMNLLGFSVSPDECALALRGIETMAIRLAHVGAVGLRLANRLSNGSNGYRVLHPGLPGAAGHDIWKRDFAGASGVFSIALEPGFEAGLEEALAGLKVFAIGASWGGTRSLIAPMEVSEIRDFGDWRASRIILRVSIGLEDERDLTSDLERLLGTLIGRSAPA